MAEVLVEDGYVQLYIFTGFSYVARFCKTFTRMTVIIMTRHCTIFIPKSNLYLSYDILVLYSGMCGVRKTSSFFFIKTNEITCLQYIISKPKMVFTSKITIKMVKDTHMINSIRPLGSGV